MCILSTIVILVWSAIVIKLLWIVRIGTLAHWSYIIGSSIYPKDKNGSLILSAGVFGFIAIGTVLPSFLCPRVKIIATALSLPPQVHMLLLLHRNITSKIDNDTVTKTFGAYTVITLISTLWTILSLLRS